MREVAVPVPTRTIDYQTEVKPLLDKRCTVCHSCYNSPCQLKLDSFEGTDRGATRRAVYNAARLSTMDPTRLFIDAQSTAAWRQKQFFSVTEIPVEHIGTGAHIVLLLDRFNTRILQQTEGFF